MLQQTVCDNQNVQFQTALNTYPVLQNQTSNGLPQQSQMWQQQLSPNFTQQKSHSMTSSSEDEDELLTQNTNTVS